MFRAASWILIAVTTLAAGCGRNSASSDALILIPAGTFVMGEATGRPDETPHTVSVSVFYLDRYAVTQELYEKVMGVNPSKRKEKKNPVERLQWTDAVRFCNKCSEQEGLTPCYDLTTWKCNFDADGYRLPTEAEWEYACRAGGTTKYCFGDDEAKLPSYAWFKPHSQGRPQPVGQKLANRWGLFDMHGNVWQWCNDWYSEAYYTESPKENPQGPATARRACCAAAPGTAHPTSAVRRTVTRSPPFTLTPALAWIAMVSGGGVDQESSASPPPRRNSLSSLPTPHSLLPTGFALGPKH